MKGLVWNDLFTSSKEWLVKDKTCIIHHQNIQSLAIEMYKAVNNLSGRKLSNFFVRRNHNYNLHPKSELTVLIINTVFKGQNFISYFESVILNSIPAELREIISFLSFEIRNKSMATTKVPLRDLQLTFIYE